MPKAKQPEKVKTRVLMLVSVERTPEDPDDDGYDDGWNAMDEITDGLMSVDTEAAITESLQNYYATDAEISILHAVEVEPPADKRKRPQFKLTPSGGVVQTV